MRSRLLVLVGLVLLLSSCSFWPMLSRVEVAPAIISPNADGVDDVTLIRYRIGRAANLSIYFLDGAGQRYYFRDHQRRSPGRYEVYWGGAVNDPQVRQVGGGQRRVESRVLPDGIYTWVVEAVDDRGHQQRAAGQVTLQHADTALPEVREFKVTPEQFRPNEDGLDDQVTISYYLAKDVPNLRLYLIDSQRPRLKYPVILRNSNSEPGASGWHQALYDGGVHDQNGRYLAAEPPPDGTYALYLEAEDRVGNRVVVSSTLTISEGGRPLAEIAGGSIDWQGEMNGKVGVPVGRRLCLTAVVINIGAVPLRTSGPWPGQAYRLTQSYRDLAATYAEPSWAEQRGVWRFGINYDTTGVDFSFRWAIGRPEDLEQRVIDGQSQYYLMPGRRGMVYGCIQFDVAPPVGTDRWWGGLIHESVQIAANNVDTVSVLVGRP